MKNILEDHPKTASVAAVVIAAAVVLFLYFLSTRPSSMTRSSTQPVFAHSKDGPVERAGADSEAQGIELRGVRDVDFESLAAEEFSSDLELESVIYADISGDGMEEAIVLLRGRGGARPLDWKLFTVRSGMAQLLYEHNNVAQGELQVQGPRLIESEGVFAEGDDPCCPSRIKKTIYTWKGENLVVSHVETAPPGV